MPRLSPDHFSHRMRFALLGYMLSCFTNWWKGRTEAIIIPAHFSSSSPSTSSLQFTLPFHVILSTLQQETSWHRTLVTLSAQLAYASWHLHRGSTLSRNQAVAMTVRLIWLVNLTMDLTGAQTVVSFTRWYCGRMLTFIFLPLSTWS